VSSGLHLQVAMGLAIKTVVNPRTHVDEVINNDVIINIT